MRVPPRIVQCGQQPIRGISQFDHFIIWIRDRGQIAVGLERERGALPAGGHDRRRAAVTIALDGRDLAVGIGAGGFPPLSAGWRS